MRKHLPALFHTMNLRTISPQRFYMAFFSYVYLQMHYMADCVLMNLVNQILRRHETNYSHQCTANMNSRREINLSRRNLSFI